MLEPRDMPRPASRPSSSRPTTTATPSGPAPPSIPAARCSSSTSRPRASPSRSPARGGMARSSLERVDHIFRDKRGGFFHPGVAVTGEAAGAPSAGLQKCSGDGCSTSLCALDTAAEDGAWAKEHFLSVPTVPLSVGANERIPFTLRRTRERDLGRNSSRKSGPPDGRGGKRPSGTVLGLTGS